MTKRRPNLAGLPTNGPGPNGAGGQITAIPAQVLAAPDGKVMAGPVPFSFHLERGRATGATEDLVMLQLLLPTGTTTVFMPPDFAAKFGQALIEHGTGITVAKPEQVPGLIVPPSDDA